MPQLKQKSSAIGAALEMFPARMEKIALVPCTQEEKNKKGQHLTTHKSPNFAFDNDVRY
jgi:hypothetical protein